MNVFPAEFLWGGAMSNVQAEGGCFADGKGLNVFDTLEVRKEYGQESVDNSDLAANHYFQYEEDISLMKEMSFKALRLSIVWSRIYPTGVEDEPNEPGLAHYEKVIDRLLEAGIEPVVSLVHFDMPDYLSKTYNGFYSKEVVDFYAHHVETVAERFRNKVKYWITYNEMNTATMTHSKLVSGASIPSGISAEEYFRTIVFNTQLAHAKAVAIIKEKAPEAKVSGMINFYQIYPKTLSPKDVLAAAIANDFLCLLTFDIMTQGIYPTYYKEFLSECGLAEDDREGLEIIRRSSEQIDFLSISYYQTCEISGPEIEDPLEFEKSVIFRPQLSMNEHLEKTDWGWSIDPSGFRKVLSTLNQRYHKPIFVVENGIAGDEKPDSRGAIDDDYRIRFYREHIKNMQDAIESDGAEIIGYLAWSPIDFLSSHKEMRKRYGFIYVDSDHYEDHKMKRTPKKSFYWYKRLIESNGASLYEVSE